MGIEPTYSAWKAEVLPLNYTRNAKRCSLNYNTTGRQCAAIDLNQDEHLNSPCKLGGGGGFEPPKAEPADLQSDPFGHSGTPPESPLFWSSPDGLSIAFINYIYKAAMPEWH